MSLFGIRSSTVFHKFIEICLLNNVTNFHRCNFNIVYTKPFKRLIPNYRTRHEEKAASIMKISNQKFKSVLTDDVKYLKNLFEENGFEIRIAGGAVRDLILGIIPKDVDFATTATPDEMKDIFKKLEIRLINRKGESHGTVTPRINDSNYEITTLRIDEITDGRHATVKYTTNWYLDASRRDLTINAMFLDLDGNVYDYFNGVEDLNNRRVAFVGDAAKRIQEDYLRILRYFRFYGRIADKPNGHEEETLSAIKENAQGLEKISGERIWCELCKILSGNYGIELLKIMLSLGLAPYIGLPAKYSLDELERISENVKRNNLNLDPMTILCALLHNNEDVQNLVLRLKPASEQRDLAIFIVEERSKGIPEQPLKYYQKMEALSLKRKFIKGAILQYLAYTGQTQTLKEYEKFDLNFPLNGKDILGTGILDQRRVGFILRELQVLWIDSDCTLTKEQLLERISELSAKYDETPPVNIKKRKKSGQKA